MHIYKLWPETGNGGRSLTGDYLGVTVAPAGMGAASKGVAHADGSHVSANEVVKGVSTPLFDLELKTFTRVESAHVLPGQYHCLQEVVDCARAGRHCSTKGPQGRLSKGWNEFGDFPDHFRR